MPKHWDVKYAGPVTAIVTAVDGGLAMVGLTKHPSGRICSDHNSEKTNDFSALDCCAIKRMSF
jgi:hypothetical protein